MENDLFSQAEKPAARGSENILVWTLALLLLVGLVAGAWVATYYIFSHPEKPFNYRMLERFGQIDPLQSFPLATAPRGEFLSAAAVYERFSNLPEYELNNRNAEFFRNYIENYNRLTGRQPYLVGKWKVIETRRLTNDNIIASGVVAIAESVEYPPVIVQCIYPCGPEEAQALHQSLQQGSIISLQRTKDLAALLHISKTRDQRLLISVVPLLYGAYTMTALEQTIQLAPPEKLNIEAGWPVIDTRDLNIPETAYREFQRQNQQETAATARIPALAPTETRKAIQPATATLPPPIDPNATPVPAAPVVPDFNASEQPSPVEQTPGTNTPPEPAGEPTPTTAPTAPSQQPAAANNPESSPANSPPVTTSAPPLTPQGAPLKPFVDPAQQPVITQPPVPPGNDRQQADSNRWQLYPPGKMPRGRLLTPDKAARLAANGIGGERLYLRGNFEVTAASQNTAIMRSRNSGFSVPGFSKPVRIVVEYPQPGSVPAQGSVFTRGALRPFQIVDVREGADGNINIITREITSP